MRFHREASGLRDRADGVEEKRLPRPLTDDICVMTRDELQSLLLGSLVTIQSRLCEPLTVELLADEVGFSASHFAAVFRGMVGESVYQHVRRLRLERAANLLVIFDRTTDVVAREVGFETREAFARAFKSAFGVGPDRFRRERRHEWRLTAPSGIHLVGDGDQPQFTPIPDRSRLLNVLVLEQPPFRVAFQRVVGPVESAHRVWYTFLPMALANGLIGRHTSYLGLSYDDDRITDAEQYRYDAAILLAEDSTFRGFGPIGVREFPASLEARLEFVGTFAECDQAWNAFIYQWLPQSGYALNTDCSIDEYHIPAGVVKHPIRTIEAFLKQMRVTLRIPVRRLQWRAGGRQPTEAVES